MKGRDRTGEWEGELKHILPVFRLGGMVRSVGYVLRGLWTVIMKDDNAFNTFSLTPFQNNHTNLSFLFFQTYSPTPTDIFIFKDIYLNFTFKNHPESVSKHQTAYQV